MKKRNSAVRAKRNKTFPARGKKYNGTPEKKAAPTTKGTTFYGLVIQNTPDPSAPVAKSVIRSSPLAHLDYAEELKVKNRSLRQFWQHHRLPGEPEPLIASPRPRQYRTTSKRRTISKGPQLYLFLGDKNDFRHKHTFVESPLEPQEHGQIYRLLQKKISEPSYRIIANHLNYLIIRGNYKEQAVIFNVDTLNGPLVRKLKQAAQHLKKEINSVAGAYIYPAPTGSDYYLEERRPANLQHFKRLYGSSYIKISHNKYRYHFHPTSFSQVNESIVPEMLTKAQELLDPRAGEILIDLYCGYGLFSHFLAPFYKKVIGIDAEGPSIRSAIANKKLNSGSAGTKFLAHRITGKVLDKVLPPMNPGLETIILDPPRQGPHHDVIEALATRRPARVLHIHCAVEQVPFSIREWQRNGYVVQRVIPLDMFPGSANLEVMIFFTPDPDEQGADKG